MAEKFSAEWFNAQFSPDELEILAQVLPWEVKNPSVSDLRKAIMKRGNKKKPGWEAIVLKVNGLNLQDNDVRDFMNGLDGVLDVLIGMSEETAPQPSSGPLKLRFVRPTATPEEPASAQPAPAAKPAARIRFKTEPATTSQAPSPRDVDWNPRVGMLLLGGFILILVCCGGIVFMLQNGSSASSTTPAPAATATPKVGSTTAPVTATKAPVTPIVPTPTKVPIAPAASPVLPTKTVTPPTEAPKPSSGLVIYPGDPNPNKWWRFGFSLDDASVAKIKQTCGYDDVALQKHLQGLKNLGISPVDMPKKPCD